MSIQAPAGPPPLADHVVTGWMRQVTLTVVSTPDPTSPQPPAAPPLVYYGKRPPRQQYAPPPPGYRPPYAPVVGPPPAPKKGMPGWAIALIAIGGLVLAIAAVPIVVLAAGGASSGPSSAAAQDVRVSTCSQSSNEFDFLGPVAKVEVTNHTQRSHSYWITVEFISGSTRIGTGSASVSDLAPGMSQTVDATSWQNDNKLSAFSCKVTQVTRI
jgi:hypothetical protein